MVCLLCAGERSKVGGDGVGVDDELRHLSADPVKGKVTDLRSLKCGRLPSRTVCFGQRAPTRPRRTTRRPPLGRSTPRVDFTHVIFEEVYCKRLD